MEKSISLSQKVIRGGAWVFTLNIVTRGLGFIRTVILARLLLPSDFGLVGIAMIATSMLLTFSGTGFAPALIQKKSGTADYLNTAWCVEAIRGIVLAFILFLLAPLVATFFNNPEAKLVIQVMAIAMALGGFTNMGMIYFQKELQFEKLFIYNFSTQMATLIVSVSLAFILRNVWALVYGTIVGVMTKLILSYALHPFRPSFKFDLDKAKELFRFGRWLFGSGILVFLITQADDIFVGKLLGVAALGFYTMAYRLSNLPATEITHVVSQVTFPAYSKLQDNFLKLKEGYLKTIQLIAFISIPLAGGIFISAPEFTRIILGEKWMPMVPAMQVLALWGLIRSLGSTQSPLLYAIGKPQIITKIHFLQAILLISIIYPFTIKWGILGASLAVLLTSLINPIGYYAYYYILNKIRCPILTFVRLLVIPLISTLVMVLFIKLFFIYLPELNFITFLGAVGIGILIYLGVIYYFEKQYNYNITNLVKQIIPKKTSGISAKREEKS